MGVTWAWNLQSCGRSEPLRLDHTGQNASRNEVACSLCTLAQCLLGVGWSHQARPGLRRASPCGWALEYGGGHRNPAQP